MGEQASEQRGRQDSLARPLLSRYAISTGPNDDDEGNEGNDANDE
jgi:hypothetical protein